MKKLLSVFLAVVLVLSIMPQILLVGNADGNTGDIDLPGDCFHSKTEIRNASAATCTTAGYTGDTYCVDCDAKLADGSDIPALGHELVWDGNVGDGQHTMACQRTDCDYTEKVDCTMVDGTCSVCGYSEASEDPIEVSTMTIGTTLSLNSDLSINFRVKNATSGYDLSTAYLVVEKDQYPAGEAMYIKTTTIEKYTIANSRVCFQYSGITAAEMNDEVRATFYVKGTDGKLYCSPTKVTSVCGYVTTALAANPTDELRTCLIDMLNYGTAAQTYFGRHTDALANAAFEDYQQYASTELSPEVTSVKETIATGCENNLVTKFGAALDMNSSIGIIFTITGASSFTSDNIAGLKLVIKDSNGNILDTITSENFTIDSKNRIKCTSFVLTARQMRTPVYATLYAEDTIVSDTFVYSIASYLVDVSANMPGTALESMIEAMIMYGDAADKSL